MRLRLGALQSRVSLHWDASLSSGPSGTAGHRTGRILRAWARPDAAARLLAAPAAVDVSSRHAVSARRGADVSLLRPATNASRKGRTHGDRPVPRTGADAPRHG